MNAFGEPNYRELEEAVQAARRRQLGADAACIRTARPSRCSICRARRRTRRQRAHIFGTDDRGRDVFARLAYGFNVSLTFALLVLADFASRSASSSERCSDTSAASSIFSGQRLIEIWSSLPFLYTIIIVSSIVVPDLPSGPKSGHAAVVLAAGRDSRDLRLDGYHLLRSRRVLSREGEGLRRRRNRDGRVRAGDHVQAHPAERADAGRLVRAVRRSWPISARWSRSIFLGFGLPAPTPSWGELIGQGTENLTKWWLVFFPLGALFVTLLLVVFIGEAVREAFDPKEYFETAMSSTPLLEIRGLRTHFKTEAGGAKAVDGVISTSIRAKCWGWSASPARARASRR